MLKRRHIETRFDVDFDLLSDVVLTWLKLFPTGVWSHLNDIQSDAQAQDHIPIVIGRAVNHSFAARVKRQGKSTRNDSDVTAAVGKTPRGRRPRPEAATIETTTLELNRGKLLGQKKQLRNTTWSKKKQQLRNT